jgi:hypothetical protein
VLLVLAFLVTGVLAACGDRPPELAAERVRAAVVATADAETGRVTVAVDGVVDAEATFAGRVDGTAVDGTVSVLGADIPVRVVDGVAYAKVIGDRWFGVATDRFGERGGAPATVGEVLAAAGLLDALREVGDVRAAGFERIGGTDTTRYDATVRIADLAGTVPGNVLPKLEERLGAQVPVTVWVDGDGLVRRAVVALGSGDLATTVQVDVSDLGMPVVVEAPPADQVTMLG